MDGFKRFAEKGAEQRTEREAICVAALVEVAAFDKEKMTVDVHPLSKRIQDGKYESQPPVLGVPIADCIGQETIKRPMYKKGDIGVVVYMDHDTDNIVKKGGESNPNTERSHSADDAVFFGGIRTGKTVIGPLPDGYAIARLDGSMYLVLTEQDFQVKGDIKIEGNVEITGNVKITGNVELIGNESISGKLIVNGIDFDTHRHGSVAEGSGLSDVPQ